MKKATRFKTFYGIPVPPWKPMPMGRCITLVFIMQGRIPSKKNELVAVVDRNDAFKYLNTLGDKITKKDCITALFKTFARIKNSLKYEEWEAAAVETFKDQLSQNGSAIEKHGIIFPVPKAIVKVKFYWKGKYRRDNSNKAEGIHDALVKAHIILDDSDRVMPDTSQGARDYSEEVLQSMAVAYVTIPIK